MSSLIKGVRYRNWAIYNFLLFLRFGFNCNLRYKIAAECVNPGESVLDLCSGAGDFKKFLPKGCLYSCVDASPQFRAMLKAKNIPFVKMDLHKGIGPVEIQTDVCVMIAGLCQFRSTSMDLLLEDFKKVSKRIVIVEYVRDREVAEGSFVHRVNNYLKDTDFTIDDKEFSEQEFMKVMALHGYRVKVCKGNYRVGLYERN